MGRIALYDNSKSLEQFYFNTEEQTSAKSYQDPSSLILPWNPDDLYQKRGDYKLYEEMEKDDQVNVCMRLKTDLVIGSGWELEVEEDNQQEIADFLYKALDEDLEGTLDDALEEFLRKAYGRGFAIAEKVFKLNTENQLVLRSLKTRHENSWTLHTDDAGNMIKYEQTSKNKMLEVDPRCLVHYIVNGANQNPYGNSDLRAAYQAYISKLHIARFYNIFLEKYASPVPVAKYNKNMPEEKIAEIHEVIKSFQVKTAITVPDSVMIEFLEGKGNGDVYRNGINLFNMFIGRALFVPDLIGLQGSETAGGAYSLGQEQIAIFLKHISRRRRALERLVCKHIIEPLVHWNFGLVEYYPKFKFKEVEDKNAVEYAKIFVEAAKGGLYKPTDAEINHFRALINFPESDEVERVEAPKVQGVGIDANMPNEKPAPEAEEAKEFAIKEYKDIQFDFHKKVDFKALGSQLDAAQKALVSEAVPLIDAIYEDIFDQIRKKKILGDNPHPERIESIKVKRLSELNRMLKKDLKDHYITSRNIARKELFKGNFALPLASDKFLAFLEEDIYQFIGDWEYAATKNVRLQLMNAIRDGTPISEVTDVLHRDGKNLSEVQLERYARTKFTEVMNRARVEEFENSKVIAAYQYSAILDDRTSDICDGLHGKVFAKGTEPVPPMHFNAITEDTLIRTKRGNIPVKNVVIGDIVLSHNGNWCRVYDVMSKFEEKEYLQIELNNGRVINITAEHPVLCDRGWIRADELTLADDIVCFEDLCKNVAPVEQIFIYAECANATA